MTFLLTNQRRPGAEDEEAEEGLIPNQVLIPTGPFLHGCEYFFITFFTFESPCQELNVTIPAVKRP